MSRAGAAFLLALAVLAGCGGAAEPTLPGSPGVPAGPGAADPHPCDLLSPEQAAAVLGVAEVGEAGLVGDPAAGSQASCTWTAGDGAVIDLVVEGPDYYVGGAAPYPDASAGYGFWRDDALEAGLPVIDLEGAGDAAFTPVFGPEPATSLVMLQGEYLVQVTMLGAAGEERLLEVGRLVATALGAAAPGAGSG